MSLRPRPCLCSLFPVTPGVLGMMMMEAEIQVTVCPMVRVVTGDLGPIMMVTMAQVCLTMSREAAQL